LDFHRRSPFSEEADVFYERILSLDREENKRKDATQPPKIAVPLFAPPGEIKGEPCLDKKSAWLKPGTWMLVILS
jgi:hypothetical protein